MINEVISSSNSLKFFVEGSESSFHPDEIVAQIKALIDLPQGWDFGSGDVISSEVIRKAIEVYKLTLPYSLMCTIHPTSEGGITLVLSTKDKFLDVTIEKNLGISLTKEQGIGFDYHIIYSDRPVSYHELIQEIQTISIENCIECISSEPFTLRNTIRESEDFKVIASNHTETEYQFLNTNAH
ncbi:hypothetical protein [Dyadobacter sp.]|uniref:hypothetical protein n=1 Tax=Dyadobacter sp. TaxID=1914288 RepID=UPI003F706EA1